MTKLIIRSKQQIAELWQQGFLVKSYRISTAANGLGCEADSYCTPSGKLQVAQKIGDGAPIGTVFMGRQLTGEIWPSQMNISESLPTRDCGHEDLVLTRILWLEGVEDNNNNTLDRYIYLHGTNQENKLGTPASHGCIRFSNQDIIEVFDTLDIGDEVLVE